MLSPHQKKRLLLFLSDDVGTGDVTAAFLPKCRAAAVLTAKEQCIVAGMEEAEFLAESNGLFFKPLKKDSEKARRGEAIANLSGNAGKIVSVERTILNVMGRMSAVATISSKAVAIARGRTKIFLTRKTMPGFNEFDKKAAAAAGAYPHRLNLAEMILLKPNHLLFFDSITNAINESRKTAGKAPVRIVEVEAKNIEEALEAAQAGAEWVMLDNFSAKNACRAVKEIRKIAPKTIIECSGEINLRNLGSYASIEPDIISMGELTKKAGMIDFSLYVSKKNW